MTKRPPAIQTAFRIPTDLFESIQTLMHRDGFTNRTAYVVALLRRQVAIEQVRKNLADALSPGDT